MFYYWVVCSIIVMVRWDEGQSIHLAGTRMALASCSRLNRRPYVLTWTSSVCDPAVAKAGSTLRFFPIAVVPSLSGSTALVDRATFPRKEKT